MFLEGGKSSGHRTNTGLMMSYCNPVYHSISSIIAEHPLFF